MNNYKDTILKDFLLIERKYYDEENFHYKSDHFLTNKNNKAVYLQNLINTTSLINFTEVELEKAISTLIYNYREKRECENNVNEEYIGMLIDENKSLERKIKKLEEKVDELKNNQ